MTLNQIEINRKDRLLDALIQLEMEEQDRIRKEKFKYDKEYDGIATVLNVEPTNLRLAREDGRRNINMAISEEVAGLIQEGDDLVLKVGRHNKRWHLLFVTMVCTPTESGQMMISIRNPMRAATLANAH